MIVMVAALVVVLALSALVYRAVRVAPEGYENSTGFHYGPAKPEVQGEEANDSRAAPL